MDVMEIRRAVIGGQVAKLSDEELQRVAATAKEPIMPSACCNWAEREAIPLLRELAARLERQSEKALERWLQTTFRQAVLDDARVLAAAAVLKVGVESHGESLEAVRKMIAAFVHDLIVPEAPE